MSEGLLGLGLLQEIFIRQIVQGAARSFNYLTSDIIIKKIPQACRLPAHRRSSSPLSTHESPSTLDPIGPRPSIEGVSRTIQSERPRPYPIEDRGSREGVSRVNVIDRTARGSLISGSSADRGVSSIIQITLLVHGIASTISKTSSRRPSPSALGLGRFADQPRSTRVGLEGSAEGPLARGRRGLGPAGPGPNFRGFRVALDRSSPGAVGTWVRSGSSALGATPSNLGGSAVGGGQPTKNMFGRPSILPDLGGPSADLGPGSRSATSLNGRGPKPEASPMSAPGLHYLARLIQNLLEARYKSTTFVINFRVAPSLLINAKLLASFISHDIRKGGVDYVNNSLRPALKQAMSLLR